MLLKREDLVPWAEQSYPRRVARRIVDDPWFNRFVMSIVLVNIVIMAMYHADMSDGFASALEVRAALLSLMCRWKMLHKLTCDVMIVAIYFWQKSRSMSQRVPVEDTWSVMALGSSVVMAHVSYAIAYASNAVPGQYHHGTKL